MRILATSTAAALAAPQLSPAWNACMQKVRDPVVRRDDRELALRSNRPCRDRLWLGRGERASRRELEEERQDEP